MKLLNVYTKLLYILLVLFTLLIISPISFSLDMSGGTLRFYSGSAKCPWHKQSQHCHVHPFSSYLYRRYFIQYATPSPNE